MKSVDCLTPRYAKYLVGLVRPFPNFDVAFIKPIRERAVGLLRLKPGNRVLDLGCGIGGSFPYLAEAVGQTGEVVGVEISPDVAVNALRRIQSNGWSNVRVVQAPAHSAQLSGVFDAALAFAAPDVYASAPALDNVLAHLRPGSRIVIFGAKTTPRLPGAVLNSLLKRALRTFSFDTTPLPSAEPWSLLAKVVCDLEVADYFFGTMFLASATLAPEERGVT